MKSFIAGRGEVGRAIAAVLTKRYGHEQVVSYDVEDGPVPQRELMTTDMLHICFPYGDHFLCEVAQYASYIRPGSPIVVHSTVPVGICRKIGPYACHSPVHGVHPNIEDGLYTFMKYVGGQLPEVTDRVVGYLREAGIFATAVSSPEAAELSKLCCTLQYGLAIAACKGIAALCEEYGVPFNEVYGWNAHYNAGYRTLDKPEVCRPVLKPVPGPIGGHCVVPNARLLPGPLSEFLLAMDARFAQELAPEAVQ